MGINLFSLVLVQADETVQNVVACCRVVVSALVIREVVLHWRDWELLFETIDLVQKQDNGGLDEPSGVADGVEEGECLLHTVDSLVLEKKLVVLGNGDKKENGCDILEAMNPLLTLRTLSTNIEHSVRELSNNERRLSDTGGLDTRSQNILVVWHIIMLCDSGDVVKIA